MANELPYVVCLDSKFQFDSGSFAGGVTTWDLPISETTIDAVVLSDDFPGEEGTVLTPTMVGASVTVNGDYSTGRVIIGRKYTSRLTLSRPWSRTRNVPDLHGMLHMRTLTTMHHQTLAYKMRVNDLGIEMIETLAAPAAPSAPRNGQLMGHFGGSVEDLSFFIEDDDSPRPFTIAALEFTATAAVGVAERNV